MIKAEPKFKIDDYVRTTREYSSMEKARTNAEMMVERFGKEYGKIQYGEDFKNLIPSQQLRGRVVEIMDDIVSLRLPDKLIYGRGARIKYINECWLEINPTPDPADTYTLKRR